MGTLITAYLGVWLVSAGYLGWLGVQQRRLQQRLQVLEKMSGADSGHSHSQAA